MNPGSSSLHTSRLFWQSSSCLWTEPRWMPWTRSASSRPPPSLQVEGQRSAGEPIAPFKAHNRTATHSCRSFPGTVAVGGGLAPWWSWEEAARKDEREEGSVQGGMKVLGSSGPDANQLALPVVPFPPQLSSAAHPAGGECRRGCRPRSRRQVSASSPALAPGTRTVKRSRMLARAGS